MKRLKVQFFTILRIHNFFIDIMINIINETSICEIWIRELSISECWSD
jgi:hypothetical protein